MSVGNYSLSALGGQRDKTTIVKDIEISGEVYDENSNIKTTTFYDWHAKFDYYTDGIQSNDINLLNKEQQTNNRSLFNKFIDSSNIYPQYTEFVNLEDLGNSFTILLNSNDVVNNDFFKITDNVKHAPIILDLHNSNINFICHVSLNFDVKTDISFESASFHINNNSTNQRVNHPNYVIPKHAIFLNTIQQVFQTHESPNITDTTTFNYSYNLKKGWNRIDIFILHEADIGSDITDFDITNYVYVFSLGWSFKIINDVIGAGALKQRVNQESIICSDQLRQEFNPDNLNNLSILNNNFNLVSAYYPNTNNLFINNSVDVKTLKANSVNCIEEISEFNEKLEERYVLRGEKSKFDSLYIVDIPPEPTTNNAELYIHLKFDKIDNLVSTILELSNPILEVTYINKSTVTAYKIVEVNDTKIHSIITDQDYSLISSAYHVIGNNSLHLNKDPGIKNYLQIQLINVDDFSYNFQTSHSLSFMFWFQYENIETNNIQYIFQLHNKLLIPQPSFKNSAIEIFLKNTNDQVNLHIFISYNTREYGYGYTETQIDTIRFEKKKWYHIAYAQNLYKSYLLINGTKFDLEPDKRFMEDLNPALFINIGANLLNGTGNNKTPIIYDEEANDFFNGYIDDFRYYKMCVEKSFIESNIIGKLLNITTSTISSFGNIGITLKQYENKIGIGTYDPITNLHIVGDTLIDGGFSTKNPIEIINVSNIHSTYSTSSNAIVSNNIYINTRKSHGKFF